jgi:hypothetical protein
MSAAARIADSVVRVVIASGSIRSSINDAVFACDPVT